MTPVTSDEYDKASACADELVQRCLKTPVTQVEFLCRSHAFPDTRLVWKVESSGRNYALKLDTLSPETGRLGKEFDLLEQLTGYFKTNPTNRVVRPVYLSPSDQFMVTEFVDRPTATDIIYNSNNEAQVAQIYRRSGSWLHDLHGFKASTDYAFRPRWMTESIDDLSANLPPHVAQITRPMVESFLNEAVALKNRMDLRVFSHGDFHGSNLIMGKGTSIGLDFTEARDKLAVYDIVDLLKADIFRDGDESDVDRSGILSRNKQMFFRQYRHPVDMEVLDCCLRGRLLKDWLRLWQAGFTCSDFELLKRDRLELRLKQAFRSAQK